jgi:hypothetical protein
MVFELVDYPLAKLANVANPKKRAAEFFVKSESNLDPELRKEQIDETVDVECFYSHPDHAADNGRICQ